MKITQEQFDKLKQLDRIEYRQKILLNQINFRNLTIWGLGLVASALLPLIFSFGCFVMMIVCSIKYFKGEDDINKQYFKTKVEVKK